MKTSAIAGAKNNLSQLIHQLESDEAIHLTRHGKPVAVMLSEASYAKLTQKSVGLFHAIQQWRSQIDSNGALTETELKNLRAAGEERHFSSGE
jgi:prevent-host-death family protein